MHLVEKPKVSVVIPAYNEEKYIGTTLFHLVKQKPYEIIIADSHSDDNTSKISREYGAKVVQSKKPGPAAARNLGGRAAKGSIVLFLDADSIVFPNLLDTIRYDFANKRKMMGWTCSIYGFSPSWKEQVIYNMSNNLVEFLTKHVQPHAPGIVIAVRKRIFDKTKGFDEKLRVMEDHDFAMRVGKHGKFMFSKDTCVFTSTRRMDKWGGWGLIKKYAKIYVKYFLSKSEFKKKIDEIEYEAIR